MNLWVNFGLKFSLFYKGKMAKISPKINKIEKGGKYSEKENIFLSEGEEKQRRKRRKIFEDGKYIVCGGEEKKEKEKEENIWRKKVYF